jgi:NAD(P)-dependent dehydrogenase (short-subunit alcohol dehydrogenase family)
MAKPNKSIVITGASTGIGYACAEYMAKKGWTVFPGVRKEADAEKLRKLGEKVHPVMMDVTDTNSVLAAAEEVRGKLGGQTLGGLVNNAGVAVTGPAIELPIEDFQRQMDINVTGVLRSTQAFAPLLGTDHDLQGPPGRVIQISSMAGEMGAPFLSAYASSKHAVEGMSKSLRRELTPYGIQVIVLGPGAVATPIWDKADDTDISGYEKSDYWEAMNILLRYMVDSGPKGFPPVKIAKRVHASLTQEKPRYRYAIVPQRLSNWTIPRLLPARTVDKLVTDRLGLKRRFRMDD